MDKQGVANIRSFLDELNGFIQSHDFEKRYSDAVQDISSGLSSDTDSTVWNAIRDKTDGIIERIGHKLQDSADLQKQSNNALTDFAEQMKQSFARSHEESLEFTERYAEDYGSVLAETGEWLDEIAFAKARYKDLGNRQRFSQFMLPTKQRYTERIRESMREYSGDLVKVYDRLTQKLRNMFSTTNDSRWHMSQKELYRMLDENHATMVSSIRSKAESVTAGEDVLDGFMARTGKKMEKITTRYKRRAVFIMSLPVILLLTVVASVVAMTVKTVKESGLTETLQSAGSNLQQIKQIQNIISSFSKTATSAGSLGAAGVLFLLLIGYALFCVFVWELVKRALIRKLSIAAQNEVDAFKSKNTSIMKQEFKAALQQQLDETEKSFAKEYQGLLDKANVPLDSETQGVLESFMQIKSKWQAVKTVAY